MEQTTPFDNQSRIGGDSCAMDQRSIQNTEASNYALQNYFLSECSMQKPIEFATSQPSVFYKGGHLGAGGCNVDDNSELLLGSVQTHPKSKIDLYERPYMTVPYLGKGSVDSVVESRLMQGERESNRRSVNKLGEKSYMNHTTTPLIDSVSDNIQNPQHIVEEDAHNGWVRGGYATRDALRDTD